MVVNKEYGLWTAVLQLRTWTTMAKGGVGWRLLILLLFVEECAVPGVLMHTTTWELQLVSSEHQNSPFAEAVQLRVGSSGADSCLAQWYQKL